MTLDELKARKKRGRCLVCGRPAMKGMSLCRKLSCRRERARLYQQRIRKPSALIRVTERQLSPRLNHVRLLLECGCITERYRSKAHDRVRCPAHPDGLPGPGGPRVFKGST